MTRKMLLLAALIAACFTFIPNPGASADTAQAINCTSVHHDRPPVSFVGWQKDPCSGVTPPLYAAEWGNLFRAGAGTDWHWNHGSIDGVRTWGYELDDKADGFNFKFVTTHVVMGRAAPYSGVLTDAYYAGTPGNPDINYTNTVSGVGCGSTDAPIGTTGYSINARAEAYGNAGGDDFPTNKTSYNSYYQFATDGNCYA